jgi:hypothetical protein
MPVKELVRLAQEQQAEINAMRALLAAMIATYPQPEALLDAYLDAMNLAADILKPDRVQHYRPAAQYWLNQISARTSR